MVHAATAPFGPLLRQWRAQAGLSQLALAAEAGTSPRYVSFLESGRARPGPGIVLRLADALRIPVGERNALLRAAGLSALYPDVPLDAPLLAPVRTILERVLRGHEPFPAWVVGPGLHFLAANQAAEALIPGLCRLTPDAIVTLWFGEGPLRQLVVNWPAVAWAGLAALRREAALTGDPAIHALLRHALAQAGRLSPPPDGALLEVPAICPVFRIGDQTIRTLSTVMRFDSAVEVTTASLRVELMFPADDASETYFRDRAGAAPAGSG
ncbi:transcriptional regulator with XRE-family HTH domain [Deinococcus metalli]|uniref:Transcriptional regulator n=1 Tax=Deinococcus metalli TaxID=1141878 RepID=A0A7W8KLJ6_9DEIO|nr:helix-turn-helix transcriptional regulator [Deinococcus metalli]MBB5379231.1 transcriptional regulator with XRE-family HTH domain [Deinococcus metalli]GHF65579.1 transcriptional regulator [Deinococcus metalli]